MLFAQGGLDAQGIAVIAAALGGVGVIAKLFLGQLNTQADKHEKVVAALSTTHAAALKLVVDHCEAELKEARTDGKILVATVARIQVAIDAQVTTVTKIQSAADVQVMAIENIRIAAAESVRVAQALAERVTKTERPNGGKAG